MRILLACLFSALSLFGQPFVCSPIGEQRTLVIIINGYASEDWARAAFFGATKSVDTFYRESSYGRAWFTGDVVTVAMQMPNTCDLPLIAVRASEAAALKGYSLDLYTRRAYLGALPCSFAGIGAFGCGMRTAGGTTYGQVWIRTAPIQHEMGHSFGLAHANLYGYAGEYGDKSDTMGVSSSPFNAPHRLQLGWTDGVQDVVADGAYSICPLEAPHCGPQILRIQKPDTGEQYYLSYRQRIGEWAQYMSSTFTAGANIHVWSPPHDPTIEGHVTKLVDTTPGSSMGFLDAPLSDGASYYDAANGITITQLSHMSGASGWATVSVSFGGEPPAPPPAQIPLAISPTSITLRAGQSMQFSANKEVAWSLSGPGTLSASGLYAAPSFIARRTAAYVSATSGDETKTATVTLQKGK